jgi:hypothetical protein
MNGLSKGLTLQRKYVAAGQGRALSLNILFVTWQRSLERQASGLLVPLPMRSWRNW